MILTDTIRKMTGWCPDVVMIEANKALQFNDPAVSASGSDGELPHVTSRWWNKYHNRILLYSSILTLLAISFFISNGRTRPDVFMTGIISGLVFGLFFGVTEWRRLNKAAAGESRRQQQMFVHYLVITGLIFTALFMISYLAVYTGSNISDIYAFGSGFILIVWTQFFEVVYWEWKNKKILIVEKASFYAAGYAGT